VVATAMAHAGAEAAPSRVGRAMGLYIGGTSAGGAIGRLLPGALVDSLSWRGATVAVTVMCACAIAVFVATLPPPRASSATGRAAGSAATRTGAPGSYLRAHRRSWRLCFLGFTLMGAYVSTFSLLAFRLQPAPFRLPMTVISLLYLLGVAGTISSPLAGRLADRRGRPRVLLASMSIAGLGLALTTSHEVTVVIAGLALFAAAFFAAHGVATGWVSATAGDASGRASASYLTAYYSGSAILAPTTALVFQHAGWTVAVVTLIALLAAAQLAMLGAECEGAKRSGPVRRIALALGR